MYQCKDTPELRKKARYYLDHFETVGNDEVIPSLVGLSCYIKVASSTIYEWINNKGKNDHSEFSSIAKEITARQKLILQNKGLDKTFSHSITKLLLSKHGVIEKTESEVDQNVNINIIDKF